MADLAMWGDETGNYIIIGDEDCKPGDPIIMIANTPDNVIAWIKALTEMLENDEIISIPGDIGTCTNVNRRTNME